MYLHLDKFTKILFLLLWLFSWLERIYFDVAIKIFHLSDYFAQKNILLKKLILKVKFLFLLRYELGVGGTEVNLLVSLVFLWFFCSLQREELQELYLHWETLPMDTSWLLIQHFCPWISSLYSLPPSLLNSHFPPLQTILLLKPLIWKIPFQFWITIICNISHRRNFTS